MRATGGAPRVLVISPHMPRALALRAAGATVDHRQSAPDAATDPFDCAVIDLAEPGAAAEALARLRQADPQLPVVLLSPHPTLAALDGVTVVLPPASGEDILAAIPRRDGATAMVVTPTVAPEAGPVGRRREPSPSDVAALATRARSVSAVAEDLAAALADRLDSDVAVLFRRGARWRVIAGRGLRPLEWRDVEELPAAMALLTPDHPTLSVGDSDDLRSQLIGAPLARHLSVLMTRTEDLVVVLGREHPYRKADVQTLVTAVRDERDDLTTACELLRLADELETHRLP